MLIAIFILSMYVQGHCCSFLLPCLCFSLSSVVDVADPLRLQFHTARYIYCPLYKSSVPLDFTPFHCVSMQRRTKQKSKEDLLHDAILDRPTNVEEATTLIGAKADVNYQDSHGD